MEYTTIIFEKKDGIAKITLNRTDKLNAINSVMMKELNDAVEDVRADESITVLITTGNGRAFSAGLDTRERAAGTPSSDTGPQFRERVRSLPIPTIAAVNGFALTGGLELALSHDIIIASENAVFADTHAKIRRLPRITLQLLPCVTSQTRARLICFTDRNVTAKEAYDFGIVAMVVTPDQLVPTAEKIAKEILSNNREAVISAKHVLNTDQEGAIEAGLRTSRRENAYIRSRSRPKADEQPKN